MTDKPVFGCFFALLLLTVVAGCAGRAPNPPIVEPDVGSRARTDDAAVAALGRDLTGYLADPAVRQTIWGVHVRSLDRAETLYALNDRVLLLPASAMKLVTLAVAAERLGWGFRYETRLLTGASVTDGVLEGDLFVRGSGDPTIRSPFSPQGGDTNPHPFRDWAQQLRDQGITRIAGRIVGDDRGVGTSDGVSGLGLGWAWNDLVFGFAARGGALQLDQNVVDLVIVPAARPGLPALVRFRHPQTGLILDDTVTTAEPSSPIDLRLSRWPGRATVVVEGSVPAGAEPVSRSVSVDRPTRFFVATLRSALHSDGIDVDGVATDVNELAQADRLSPESARTLIVHRSHTLLDFAVEMMTHSQNLMAETVFRSIGSRDGDGSPAASQAAIANVLTEWSIPSSQFVVADGSGLSRDNYVTAQLLVTVLDQMRRRSAERFASTLPVAGRDGTLANRMAAGAAAGNARAKTGSMTKVRTLSGYVQTRDGETLGFAILANNFAAPPGQITSAIDRVVERLASFAR